MRARSCVLRVVVMLRRLGCGQSVHVFLVISLLVLVLTHDCVPCVWKSACATLHEWSAKHSLYLTRQRIDPLSPRSKTSWLLVPRDLVLSSTCLTCPS